MKERGAKSGATNKRAGRPKRAFTREQLDSALELLGKEFYPSRVAGRLHEKFPDLGRPLCYRLIDAARAETAAQIANADGNPLVTLWAGYIALAANEKVKDAVRVLALNGAAKMLGMHKFLQSIKDAGDVTEYLKQVGIRQAARAEQRPAALPPATSEQPK